MKKFLPAVLALAASLIFSGCGGEEPSSTPPKPEVTATTIKVGTASAPSTEILEVVKSDLQAKGITLEVVSYADDAKSNSALSGGELDANLSQDKRSLNSALKENPELKIKIAGSAFVEPMGIYSAKYNTLEEIPFGGTVAIPSDAAGTGRALLLLDKARLITLREGVGDTATLEDIISNDTDLQFEEVDAAQLVGMLEDVDIAVIGVDSALAADLDPTEAILVEGKDSPYVSVIAVRDGDENRPEIKVLVENLHSDKVKNFIEEKYNGAIVPAF